MSATEPPVAGFEGRRAVLASLLRSLLTTTSLVWFYFVAPVKHTPSGSGIALLVVGLLVVGALLTWQIRAIALSRRPRLRAVEALATVVPLFLLLFALFYYALGQGEATDFSQKLSRVDALYFTITTFATVGYGDIVAVSPTARIAVTVQMLLDLVLIGAGLRVLLVAVRIGLSRQEEEPPEPQP